MSSRFGIKAMYEFLQEAVENNMTRNARSVSPETPVGDLYRLFGIIAREDVMKAMGRCVMRQYPPLVPFETA